MDSQAERKKKKETYTYRIIISRTPGPFPYPHVRSKYSALALLHHPPPSTLHTLFKSEREDIFYTDASLGGAFNVFRPNLFGDGLSLFRCDRRLTLGAEHPTCMFVGS